MILPPALRVNRAGCDDASVVSLLHRLSLVRERMRGLRIVEDHGTSAMLLGVGNAAGTLRINVITESKGSRLACFVSGVHDGARTDAMLCLIMPVDRNLAEEAHSDPRAVGRVLDLFEGSAARPEARIEDDAVPYRVSDPLGEALMEAVDRIGDVASAAVSSENPHDRPHAILRIGPPGLGRPGRIADHRSRRPLAAPVERALLARLPDVHVLSAPTSHTFELETVHWDRRLLRQDAVSAMRTLAGSGLPTGRTTTSAGQAAD